MTKPTRHEIETPLSQATLNTSDPLGAHSYPPPRRILPELAVIKIGGQSFMDRGGSAVLPLVEELAACAKHHRILVGAGGGTRARHIYHLALELDLPVGVLASLGAATAEQNARMLALLLAEHGGVYDETPHFFGLPARAGGAREPAARSARSRGPDHQRAQARVADPRARRRARRNDHSRMT